jgi:hypothetical protein
MDRTPGTECPDVCVCGIADYGPRRYSPLNGRSGRLHRGVHGMRSWSTLYVTHAKSVRRPMNRFIAHRSTLFVAVAILFAAALFADSANLDDLVAGRLVLHDDDAVLAASVQPGRDANAGSSTHAGQAPRSGSGTHQRHDAPLSLLIIVLDQDSPSLAAETTADLLGIGLIFSGPARPRTLEVQSGDLLYLRFCALLI